MRSKFCFVFAVLTVSLLGIASEPQSSNRKVWIFFKDRPYLLNVASNPVEQQKQFSAAAVRRRQLRGEGAWDASDFAVDGGYVQQVRAAGANIVRESRWLNAVSAICNSDCIAKVRLMPFVQEIRPVTTFRRPLEKIVNEPQAMYQQGAARLSYGLSKPQLAQLNVPKVHRKGFAGQGEIVAVFDTGFRKDHIAFKNAELIGERDFVGGDDNVSNDVNTDSHGTGTWSCVGGNAPGMLFGPAYKASFLLAATEDIGSETIVEEDNWVAAFEWADRMGASVISSSLGYRDWYVPSDFNGRTAVTSRIASTAARKGIVAVNSAGNEGPGDSTLSAPADARKMITVGAVSEHGMIAPFSSRGPTADGRLKPEVVARGVGTYVATSSNNNTFGRSNGTSFSCPLVAGTVAVLLSARQDWKPMQAREAIINTASQAETPDNTYGYGIVNLLAALDYLPKRAIGIEHRELKNTSTTGKPYKVSARIRAQRGLNTSQLFVQWRAGTTGPFSSVALSEVPAKPDRFQAFIPAQSSGTTVQYYLAARDKKGKRASFPVGAPSILFDFQVR